MSIKKIKNIKYRKTDHVKRRDQLDIISRRNTLLKNSDWIELPYANISSYEKKLWLQWRAKVKNLGNFFDVEKNTNAIKSLENSAPRITNKISEEELNKIIKSYLNDLVSFYIKFHLTEKTFINTLLDTNYNYQVKDFMDDNVDDIKDIYERRSDFLDRRKACKDNNERVELINDIKIYINNMVIIYGH